MRKKIVVVGTVLLVVGALLFVVGFFSPPRETVVDDTDTLQSGYYLYYWFEVPFGMSVHTEYTTSDKVEFCVLDSHNFELLEAGEDFDEIFYSTGKLQTHMFHAPKDDTFYIVLSNFGDNNVSVSIRISREVSWARLVSFGGAGLSAIGFVTLIAGVILRPRIAETPSRLLDVLKLNRRMKISELATRFKATEAEIELTVITLQSSGEPIKFDRETREVIYVTSEEE